MKLKKKKFKKCRYCGALNPSNRRRCWKCLTSTNSAHIGTFQKFTSAKK